MSEFSIPYEFVAGTKAKAEEVNENFNAIKAELAQKASKEGSATTQLSVADATLDEHAVNKSQLDEMSSELKTQIESKTTTFCAKSGNTTNGEADLFENTTLIITPKVGDGSGDNYKPLVIANYKGEISTRTSLNTISMTGKSDGIYNIFVPIEGNAYVLKNTIHYKAATPTMLENDVWLDIGTEPIKAFKYNGSDNIECNDVPIGTVKFENGVITKVSTNPYNQNKYNVNSLTYDWTKMMPDYSKGINKSKKVTYTATENGWGTTHGSLYLTNCEIKVNGVVVNAMYGQNDGCPYAQVTSPIPKGATYSLDGATMKFYPCIGG